MPRAQVEQGIERSEYDRHSPQKLLSDYTHTQSSIYYTYLVCMCINCIAKLPYKWVMLVRHHFHIYFAQQFFFTLQRSSKYKTMSTQLSKEEITRMQKIHSDFISQTDADPALAQDLLDATEWDLQAALQAFQGLSETHTEQCKRCGWYCNLWVVICIH